MYSLDVLYANASYVIIEQSLYLFAVPFTFSSGILMIFFWIDVTSKTMYQGAFLDKALKPAVAFIVLIFMLCFGVGIAYASGTNSNLSLSNIIFGLIIFALFIFAIIYFITASRVFKLMEDDMYGSETKTYLRHMTIKIVVSGIAVVLLVLDAVLVLAIPETVASSFTLVFFVDLLLSFRSFMQIEVFGTKRLRTLTTISNLSEK